MAGPPTTILSELAQRRREEALVGRLSAAASRSIDQRTPEVTAFLEASSLLRAARQLLPLHPSGDPGTAANAGEAPSARWVFLPVGRQGCWPAARFDQWRLAASRAVQGVPFCTLYCSASTRWSHRDTLCVSSCGQHSPSSCLPPSSCCSRQDRGRLLLAILLAARADYVAPQSLLVAWDVGRRLADQLSRLPPGSMGRWLAGSAAYMQTEGQQPQLWTTLTEQEEDQRWQQQQRGQQQQQQTGRQDTHCRVGDGASGSSNSQLAVGALLLYSYAVCADLQREVYDAVRAAARAAQMLGEPTVQAALAAQVAALESGGLELPGGRPLLTAEQLRYACWARVAESGAALLSKHRQPSVVLVTGTTRPRLSHAQQAELGALLASSVRSLLELDPANVRGLMAAAAALCALGLRHEASLVHLEAFQQAAAQQSQYWLLRAAAAAAVDSSMQASHPRDVGSSSSSSAALPAALAVLEQAGSMLSHMQTVLPDSWVHQVRADVSSGRRRLATARAQAQLVLALAGDAWGGASHGEASHARAAASHPGAVAAAAAAGMQPQLSRPVAQAKGGPAASFALRKQAAAHLARWVFGSEEDLAAASATGATQSAAAPAGPSLPQDMDWRAG